MPFFSQRTLELMVGLADKRRPLRPVGLAFAIRQRAEAIRDDANVLRRYGIDGTAAALDRLAASLDDDVAAAHGELLSLTEAAEASGYSADHLRRLSKSGQLQNYGDPYRPRFRRGELPCKPGAPSVTGENRREVARRVVNSLPKAG